MRVHRLRIEAFGPFPGTVDIDLDALSAEGLFLIHGPTGSGKTSLLDAICFALYADVPGARTKKGLRSDHAAAGAVPRVTLELTAAGRRLRIVRSPEFTRPKKRGTGVLSVQATVTLEERLGSSWVVRGTRNDEVADVVKDVMGMGMAQFASVVLLPQGDFATFLRASPDDRRAVLERLFDITDYRAVEDWLAEARREAGAELDRARSAFAAELARVEDVLAEAAAAPGTSGEPPLAELAPASVVDRVDGLLTVLDARVSTTMAHYDAAAGAERRASESLEAARALTELRTRGERALRELEVLASLSAEHEARLGVIAAAERAAGLTGHLVARRRSTDEVAEAQVRVESSRAALSHLALDAPGDDRVASVAAAVHAHDDTVVALRREADEAHARARRAASLETRAATLAAEHDEVVGHLADVDRARLELAAEVESLGSEAASVPELVLRAAAARDAMARLEASDAALARAAELAPRVNERRAAALDRRQQVLDLRTRRLEEMAGELALALSEGTPCPVCGSAEHPEPASTADPVRPEDLTRAEARWEEAEQAHRTLRDESEAHRHRAETLRATLEVPDADHLRGVLDEVTRTLGAAREAADRHERVLARHLAHVEQAEGLRRRGTALASRHASVTDQLSALRAEESEAASRLDALAAAHATCPCGAAEADDHTLAGRLLTNLQSAVEWFAAAQSRAAAVDCDLAAAVAEAGFDSTDHALAAVLPPDALTRERALCATHRDRVAAAGAVLEDPEVASALDGPAPELQALVDAARTARERLLEARTAQDEAERSSRALRRLVPVVTESGARLTRAAERDARVREVADTATGTGPENTLRMRLTSFVLAARLEKVATLANERLAVMGGGRYLLEHSDHLAARGARSGLGLRVLDQWTGRPRDTATLSGGEAFMASLALALGLADAVREEAGGLDLGTLFIDEGFGTLDDDSLEQVVTVLDGLREGGRAVGVVSHVADLRARITHQAVVHKGAAGSTVEVRVGARSEPAPAA